MLMILVIICKSFHNHPEREIMIVSTVAGRLRVRSRRLKSHGFSNRVKARIEALPGVIDVRANPGAGCLVVNYDTGHEAGRGEDPLLEESIVQLLLPASGGKNNCNRLEKQLNRATKVGMLATLTTSLTYALLGKKRPHIAYGSAFVALAGLHMARNAGRLLR